MCCLTKEIEVINTGSNFYGAKIKFGKGYFAFINPKDLKLNNIIALFVRLIGYKHF